MHAGAVDMVAHERASIADVVRSRRQHEVVDDELAVAVEEVGERLRPVGPVEHVALLDLDPGQGLPFGPEPVEIARDLLLPRQMRSPSREPFLSGHDAVLHGGRVSDVGHGLTFH